MVSATKTVTDFGRYQMFLLVLIWWGNITAVCNVVFMVFGGATDFSCLDVVVASTNQTNSTANISSSCANVSWTFHSMLVEWSLTSKSKLYLGALMTSVQLAGALVGALVGGQLADWYGRKLNTWFWLAVTVLLGSLSTLSPGWKAMMAFRFFIGLATGGYDSSTIILCMEWVSDSARLPVQTSLDCIQSVGFIWFSLLAYICKDWKTLSLVCCLQGIPCLIAFWFVEEPVRWLLQKGKVEQANNVVKKVKLWNGMAATVGPTTSTVELKTEVPESHEKTLTYLDLFKTKKLCRNSIMVIFNFLVCGSVGYMLIFNTGNLVGNIFANFALLGCVNVCAALLAVVANHFIKLGRRPLHQTGLNGVWISFTVIIVIYALKMEHKLPILLVAAAMIGSMFSFTLWVVGNLYSGELFPTEMRNMGSGIGSMAARCGGFIAPEILYLFDIWHPLPFIITGSAIMINAVLAFCFLPETRGKLEESKKAPQPTTVENKRF